MSCSDVDMLLISVGELFARSRNSSKEIWDREPPVTRLTTNNQGLDTFREIWIIWRILLLLQVPEIPPS